MNGNYGGPEGGRNNRRTGSATSCPFPLKLLYLSDVKTYLLNPTLQGNSRYIREGRCMQKASSWASAWPPLSLTILATIAQEWGNVRLLDGNVEKVRLEPLLSDIRSFAPGLVVISSGFPSIDEDMHVAAKVKEAFPEVRLVTFGVYFTMLGTRGFSQYPFLDFAITGEPEATFTELGSVLCRGESRFDGIAGILFRDKDGLRQNAPRPPITDLDIIPHPDRSLLKNSRYRLPHNNRVYTLVNTARGCPHRCTFCIVAGYYGSVVRKHSIPYILDELKECVLRYGIREFLFWEEAFTLDKKYLLEFCRALADAHLPVHWAATTRAGSLDDEIVAAMKKAGCTLCGLGIESADQGILDRALKQQTVADVRRAVALCRKHRLATMGHFIFGLPGETEATARATIRFMLKLGIDYMQCYCAVPYPNTALGAEAEEKGWIRAGKWARYDFGGTSVMSTDSMTSEEVDRFRARAFRAFYFRPWYIAKKLFSGLSVLRLIRAADFRSWMIPPHRKRERHEST
jgi:anaerobic magnesium-protoporphyrin IX monomethyl ester cyclase